MKYENKLKLLCFFHTCLPVGRFHISHFIFLKLRVGGFYEIHHFRQIYGKQQVGQKQQDNNYADEDEVGAHYLAAARAFGAGGFETPAETTGKPGFDCFGVLALDFIDPLEPLFQFLFAGVPVARLVFVLLVFGYLEETK